MKYVGQAVAWFEGRQYVYDDYLCTHCGKSPNDSTPEEAWLEAA